MRDGGRTDLAGGQRGVGRRGMTASTTCAEGGSERSVVHIRGHNLNTPRLSLAEEEERPRCSPRKSSRSCPHTPSTTRDVAENDAETGRRLASSSPASRFEQSAWRRRRCSCLDDQPSASSVGFSRISRLRRLGEAPERGRRYSRCSPADDPVPSGVSASRSRLVCRE